MLTQLYYVTKFIGVFNVSKRKETELALIKSEAKYKALYNDTPVMLQSSDSEGFIISVNDFWIKILGYSYNEIIGTKASNYLAEKSKII